MRCFEKAVLVVITNIINPLKIDYIPYNKRWTSPEKKGHKPITIILPEMYKNIQCITALASDGMIANITSYLKV